MFVILCGRVGKHNIILLCTTSLEIWKLKSSIVGIYLYIYIYSHPVSPLASKKFSEVVKH